MPQLSWLPEALSDFRALHAYLADLSPAVAARAASAIRNGANQLAAHPRLGRRLEGDRREFIIPFASGAYVLRLRLTEQGDPIILRVWHSKQSRG